MCISMRFFNIEKCFVGGGDVFKAKFDFSTSNARRIFEKVRLDQLSNLPHVMNA